jgi:hypothetical protein
LPYGLTANQIGLPTSTNNVGDVIANLVKIAMSVVGMLAVIAILVGALQYAYSAGDSKRTTQAKETIIYASVGLAVAIAALAIVTFITSYVK